MGMTPLPIVPLTIRQRWLVQSNHGLPYWVVRRWFPGLSKTLKSEAEEAAVLGLCKAATTWRVDGGCKFVTWATTKCLLAVKTYLSGVKRKFRCRVLTLGLTVSEANESKAIASRQREMAAERIAELNELPGWCQSRIPERWWFVLRERFLRGRTLDDIGDELGVTGAAVEQTSRRACEQLKELAAERRS